MSAAGMPPQRLLAAVPGPRALVCCMLVGDHDHLRHAGELPGTARPRSPRSGPISSPTSSRKASSPRSTTASPSITASAPAHALLGIFMQDRREEGQDRRLPRRARPDRRGRTARAISSSRRAAFTGKQPNSRDSSIVAFERYAVDLAAFNQDERPDRLQAARALTTQLLFPDQKELYYKIQEGRFRAELHDRLSGLALSAGHDVHRLRGARGRAHDPPGPRHRDRRRGRRRGGRCASSASRPRARPSGSPSGLIGDLRRAAGRRRGRRSLIASRVARMRALGGRALHAVRSANRSTPRLPALRRA